MARLGYTRYHKIHQIVNTYHSYMVAALAGNPSTQGIKEIGALVSRTCCFDLLQLSSSLAPLRRMLSSAKDKLS